MKCRDRRKIRERGEKITIKIRITIKRKD